MSNLRSSLSDPTQDSQKISDGDCYSLAKNNHNLTISEIQPNFLKYNYGTSKQNVSYNLVVSSLSNVGTSTSCLVTMPNEALKATESDPAISKPTSFLI